MEEVSSSAGELLALIGEGDEEEGRLRVELEEVKMNLGELKSFL